MSVAPLEAELRLDVTPLRSAVADAVNTIDGLSTAGRETGADLERALREGLSEGVQMGLREGQGEFSQFVANAREAGDDAGKGIKDGIGDAGAEAGDEAGEGLAGGITAALVALPVAGSIVGIGAAIGAALLSGMESEVTADLFAARTGLDEATVAKVGQAAGEAYANNFGATIADNMDTATAAIQSGLLDPDASAKETQAVIEQLQGVADILGEDIPRVARSASQLIKTGMAGDYTEAMDIIVSATQGGLNVSEDLLDTFDEYSTMFRDLGLDAPTALGLMSQGLQAGARDTDTMADALKEFAIRAKDGSTTSIDAYTAMGLNAEEMTARMAAGGAGATEGLGIVLEALKAIEDPVARDAAAVGIFGTKAEDLGDALFAMDLGTAAQSFEDFAGTAAGAVATMGDNTAGIIESAKRNIETAGLGIAGALAAAFGEDIQGFANFVTAHRAEVVGFLLDAANAGIEFGIGLAGGTASALRGFADVIEAVVQVQGTILDMGIDAAIVFAEIAEGLGQDGAARAAREAGLEMLNMKSASEDAATGTADALRGAASAIDSTIVPALKDSQDRLNNLGIPLVAQAAFHDATFALSADIGSLGYTADGLALQLDTASGAVDLTTEAGRKLDAQLKDVTEGMQDNLNAAHGAGEGTESLTATFNENRTALVNQLTALGFSEEAAEDLADTYGAVPGMITTAISTPGLPAAKTGVDNFDSSVREVPTSKTSTFKAVTSGVSTAESDLNYAARDRTTVITQKVYGPGGGDAVRAQGGPVWPGLGMTLVGEEGPEMVIWGGTGTVIPARATAEFVNSAATVSPTSAPASGSASAARALSVRVFIGDRELTDLVRVEVDDQLAAEASALSLGSV